MDIWVVATQKRRSTYRLLESKCRPRAIAWSPEGKQIVIVEGGQGVGASHGGDLVAVICDAVTGQKISGCMGPAPFFTLNLPHPHAVVWFPDEVRIASVGLKSGLHGTVAIWDAKTGELIFTYNKSSNSKIYVAAVAWSPNGKQIAFGGTDNIVQVWDATTWQIRMTYTGHTGAIWSVAWSPDGKYIASGSRDNTVRVWQAI